MADKFKILALDFHNTIYDEVMEYGLAIDAAISTFNIPREIIYTELSTAHKNAGSDWDNDVWKMLPCLKNIDPDIIKSAIQNREEKSRELTLNGAYPDAVRTLKQLKSQGIHIYLVTEAAANVGMLGINWLGLGGTLDGVYTYPSNHPPIELENTCHKSFPKNGNTHFKKPNPLLLADVALDHAITTNQIPQSVKLNDVFTTGSTPNLSLPEFAANHLIQRDISSELQLKKTSHKPILQGILSQMLYVGDSKFKDGIMARNAGVKFGYAAYGKKINPDEKAAFERSKDIMYAVTGWDKETLKLTQEASKSASVNALQPDYVLENRLSEILQLF